MNTSKIDYEKIDEPMRGLVKLLNNNGFKTVASCQGGEGHAFPLPRIVFEEAMGVANFLREKGIGNYSLHSVRDYNSSNKIIQRYHYIEFWNIEDVEVSNV